MGRYWVAAVLVAGLTTVVLREGEGSTEQLELRPRGGEEAKVGLMTPGGEQAQVAGVAPAGSAAVAGQEAGDGHGFRLLGLIVGEDDV